MRGPFDPKSNILTSLIVLSGLDGSGKSTQAQLLAVRLKEAGVPARVVWNRWEPMVSAPMIKLARRSISPGEEMTEEEYADFTSAKQRTMNAGWKRFLWQLMVWSEYALEVNMRLVQNRIRGRVSICDRYVYDTLIDMAINLSVPTEEIKTLCNHPLFNLYPRPACVIFLDIDPETGASRKNDGTPVRYLASRREYYISMARILGAPVVDGNRGIEEVRENIWGLTGGWRDRTVKTASGGSTNGGPG